MNMKKLFLLVFIISTLLVGCNTTNKAQEMITGKYGMIEIPTGSLSTKIHYEKSTKIMYVTTVDGGVTPLVDKDGKPLIYDN